MTSSWYFHCKIIFLTAMFDVPPSHTSLPTNSMTFICLCQSSFVSHLAAPGSPQSPGCSSSSPSPGCSEEAGAPSPAGPSPRPLHGSSPASRGSSSPAGSLTSPSLCGSSAVSLLCPTLRAGGHWPLPAIIQNREGQKGTQRLMHCPSSHPDYAFV